LGLEQSGRIVDGAEGRHLGIPCRRPLVGLPPEVIEAEVDGDAI
jgi:hypothetical protein